MQCLPHGKSGSAYGYRFSLRFVYVMAYVRTLSIEAIEVSSYASMLVISTMVSFRLTLDHLSCSCLILIEP